VERHAHDRPHLEGTEHVGDRVVEGAVDRRDVRLDPRDSRQAIASAAFFSSSA
jgi:hypothetical protein